MSWLKLARMICVLLLLPPGWGQTFPFISRPSVTLEVAPTSLVTGDVNKDGRDDVIATAATGTARLVESSSSSTFASGIELQSSSGTSQAAVADLDQDGWLDVLLLNPATGEVLIYKSDGGAFGAPQIHSIVPAGEEISSGAASRLLAGDINADGRPDLIVLRGSALSISLARAEGGFAAAEARSLTGTYSHLLAVRRGANEALDLVAADITAGTMLHLRNQGNGSFQENNIANSQGLKDLAAADLDGDGRDDLAGLATEGAAVILFLQGAEGFAAGSAQNFTATGELQSLRVGDVDGDGVVDLLLAGPSALSVLYRRAEGLVAAVVEPPAGGITAFGLARVDADGAIDLLVGGGSPAALIPYLNASGNAVLVQAEPAVSEYGTPVAVTARVAPSVSAAGTPTGTVQFFAGETMLEAKPLANGEAGMTTADLAAGAWTLRAEYGGDATFRKGQGEVAVTVTPATTTVELTADGDEKVRPAGFTFTATVTSATGRQPAGTVVFRRGEDVIGSVALGAGTATIFSVLPSGEHEVSATYEGSADFHASTDGIRVRSLVATQLQAETGGPAVYPGPVQLAVTVTSEETAAGEIVVRWGEGQEVRSSLDPAGKANLPVFPLPAGTHELGIVFQPAGAFVGSDQRITVTVAKAPLAITAHDATRPYGQPNPGFTGTVSGAVAGDEMDATYASSATSGSNVGVYDIIPALQDPQQRAANYDVVLQSGKLTVAKAELRVVTGNYFRVYGQDDPKFTPAFAGLFSEDIITANSSTTATRRSPVGEYAVATELTDAMGRLPNYNLVLQPGTLTITRAPLVVTSNPVQRFYGELNPTLTFALSGLLEGDDVTAELSTGAAEFSDVGQYPIQISMSDRDGSLGNYAVDLQPGTLTVAPAPLQVLVPAQQITYGESPAVPASDLTGLKGQDIMTVGFYFARPTTSYAEPFATGNNGWYTLRADQGDYDLLSWVTEPVQPPADAAEPAIYARSTGPWAIDGNHAGPDGQGNIALLAIAWLEGSGPYGGVLPTYPLDLRHAELQMRMRVRELDAKGGKMYLWFQTFDFSIGKFVNYALTRYPIDAQLTPGEWSTVRLPLVNDDDAWTCLGTSPTRADVYGCSTNAVGALSNINADLGIILLPIEGSPTGTVEIDDVQIVRADRFQAAQFPAGKYQVVPEVYDPDGRLKNYSLSASSAALAVQRRALLVRANDATRRYGEQNPQFSGTSSGALDGEKVLTTFHTQAVSTSDAGEYEIVPEVQDIETLAANYEIAATPGRLTVLPAPTTTTLSVEAGTVAFGDEAVLRAQVSSAAGVTSGDVSFWDGTTELGRVALDNQGAASFVTAPGQLRVGDRPVTARFESQRNLEASTSAAINVRVEQGETKLILAPVPAAAIGETVSLRARLEAKLLPASGAISFHLDDQLLGSASLGPDGSAALALKTLPEGDLTIRATYAGNAELKASSTQTSVFVGRYEAAASQAGVEFSSTPVLTTSPVQSFQFVNSGTLPFSVTGVELSGPYSVAHECGLLQPQGSCRVEVRFLPRSAGVLSGNITLRTSSSATLNVPLTGAAFDIYFVLDRARRSGRRSNTTATTAMYQVAIAAASPPAEIACATASHTCRVSATSSGPGRHLYAVTLTPRSRRLRSAAANAAVEIMVRFERGGRAHRVTLPMPSENQ